MIISDLCQLQTGSIIKNVQCFQLSAFQKNQFPHFAAYRSVQFKGNPTGGYNCHGLTFASKRTCIEDDEEINKILREDNYIEIKLITSVLPGDIIVYFGETGDIEHSGIVIETTRDFNIPIVYSKWGCYKIAIHAANNCPYNFSNAKFYRIEE